MRLTGNISIFCIVLYSLLSCTDDDEESRLSSTALDVNAAIHNTDIAKQLFIHDDCIGIYLVSFNNGVPGLLGDINQTIASNVEYTFDESGYWFRKDGTSLMLDNQPADLYAYHPYDESMSLEPEKANLTAYPFSVEADQQTDGGETSDFMWAKIPGLTVYNNTAPIVFQHLMCRCEINIRLAQGIEVTSVPQLELHNTRRSCFINLRNGEITATGIPETVIPSNNARVTQGYDFTYDAILIPQALSNGMLFLTIVLNGETYAYRLPADITMFSQRCYKFNLLAGHSQSASEITSVTEY